MKKKTKISIVLLTALMLLQSIGTVFATETTETSADIVDDSNTIQVLEKNTDTGEITTNDINYESLETTIDALSTNDFRYVSTQATKAALSSSTNVSVKAIIGGDNRTRAYNSAICYILANGQRGTGFLISPNVVVTAAHLVYDYTSKTFRTSVTVTPGKNGSISSAPYGSCSSMRIIIPEYANDGATKHDYALLILNDNLGSQAGWLNMTFSDDLLDGKTVNTQSYSSTDPSGNTSYYQWSGYGTVWGEKDLNNGNFLNNCDTTGGASGSPILLNNKVCGIHFGGSSAGNLGIKIDKRLYCILINYTLETPGDLELVNYESIGGHAFNKNNLYQQVDTHIYINDSNNKTIETKILQANLFREGVGMHAFHTSMNWVAYKPGTYKIYAYAICNDNPLLRNCPKTFTVRPTEGGFDYANASGICGWTWKPDAPNVPIQAHIYIYDKGGNLVHAVPVTANQYADYLVKGGKGNGYHMFNYQINWNNLPKGELTIRIYSVDGSGVNPLIGTRTYTNN